MTKIVFPFFRSPAPVLGLFLISMLLAIPASAQTDNMDAEIDYLISQVGRDRCSFIRNDRRMLGREARDHLQSKRERNAAIFSSTEEFIEKIASNSETSGQPYLISCARRFQFTANEWFAMLLEAYRNESN